MSRSDWKCSPVHKYWLNQSKWTFFHVNNRRGALCLSQGRRMGYPVWKITGKTWVMYKHEQRQEIDRKFLSNITNLHTNCHFKDTNLKMYHHTGGKWFIHGPQRRKENLLQSLRQPCCMMTSSNGNIFCVTGHLYGEFTGPRWIPRTKDGDAELSCFLWSAPE